MVPAPVSPDRRLVAAAARLLALLALLGPMAAWAHPGGLNSQGCHRDSQSGQTHCHGNSSPSPTRPAAPAPAATAGAVSLVSVGDGDTIRVRTAAGRPVTVRLACIDAPETAQGASGAASRQQLQRLTAGGRLELRPQTTDKYGRTVAEVIAGGRNLNLEMVRSGHAFAYRKYLKACDGRAYLAAEAQAQARRVGVWASPGGGVRPWDFRAARRR